MNIILAILLGGFFGFALYYVGASSTSVNIKNMLSLTNLTLAKIILMAIGIGSTVVGLLMILHLFDVSHFSVKPMNLGVILGGIIFGVGFYLIGSCPGTLLSGLFADVKGNLVAILGGLVGAFIFTLLYPYFNDMGVFTTLQTQALTLFHLSDKYQSLLPIGGIGVLIFGIILILGGYFMPKVIIKKS